MAIGTSNRNDYVGNAATAIYPYTFLIFSATDLYVAIRAIGAAVDTQLFYPLDFTVSGVGLAPGGNVSLSAGSLANGTALVIRRVRPLTQDTVLSNQAAYQADVVMNSLDHGVMLSQQLQDQLSRSLMLPTSAVGVDPTMPAPVANQALAYNSSGTGFTTVPTSGITVANFTSKIRIADVFSGADLGAKIAAAHADLPSTGGTVDARGMEGAQNMTTAVTLSKPSILMLAASTISMTKRFLITGNNVAIVGNGIGQTVLQASASIAYADNDLILAAMGGTYPSPTLDIAGIVIRDLTVDGNQAALGSRPYANDTHGNGINLNRCHHSRVTNCEVKNVVYQGIVATAASITAFGVEIDHCWVDSCGEIGIGVESSSSRANIHDNLVTNGLTVAEVAGGATGIYLASLSADVSGHNSDDHIVHHNTVFNMPADGIVIQDGCHRTIVSSNQVDGAARCISVLYTTDDTRVARDVNVNGNICTGATATSGGAIHVSGPGTNKFVGIVIHNNDIASCQGAGVFVQNASRPRVTNNTIRSVGLGASTRLEGIYVLTSVSPQIQGNNINGAAGNAITIGDSATTDAYIAFNAIQGNGGAVGDSGTRSVILGNIADTSGNFLMFLTGTYSITSSTDPALQLITSNGTAATLALNQAGASIWYVRNNATTGDLAFNQNSTDWLLIKKTTGAASFAGTLASVSLDINGSAPTVSAGHLGFGAGTTSTASNGAGEAMKANVGGYLVFNLAGTTIKVPYLPT